MKITTYNNEDEWLDARRGKITGTRLKDLIVKRGTGYKLGFYEIIAERIAIPANGENVMDRGHRLEVDAVVRFEKETGKEVDKSLVIMHRDDDDNIAYSPDGFIGDTEDVEVKCLSSARHLQAYLTKEVPGEYWEQVLQGFIVNDKLEKRYILFYDPRMPVDFFWIEVSREQVQQEVEEYLALERDILKQIDELEKQLTF